MKEKKIFISHASKDKKIADAFVDIILQGALSVSIEDIFCVSTDGTKIKSGENWRNRIKTNLKSAKINFLIITPNYKESEVCLNEMGAAWVLSALVLPLIIEPINFKTVGIIQEPKQIEKLLDEKSLDRIKDIVQEELEIPNKLIKSDRWTSKKKEFILTVKSYLKKHSFNIPINREEFESLIEEKKDLEVTIENLIEEKNELNELIDELKTIKDKSEVKKIISKRKFDTEFKEFENICSNVNKKLGKNPAIINGIIFKSFSRKEISINHQGYNEILDEAIANDYITDELEADFSTTRKLREIKDELVKVSSFLERNLSPDFYDEYEDKYDAPMKINNKLFWEEVFGTQLII